MQVEWLYSKAPDRQWNPTGEKAAENGHLEALIQLDSLCQPKLFPCVLAAVEGGQFEVVSLLLATLFSPDQLKPYSTCSALGLSIFVHKSLFCFQLEPLECQQAYCVSQLGMGLAGWWLGAMPVKWILRFMLTSVEWWTPVVRHGTMRAVGSQHSIWIYYM